MTTIPASELATVNPSVIGVGGAAFDITGLLLTPNPEAPAGQVLSFSSQAAVGAYFGLASAEATFATTYFLGFDGSTTKPATLLVSQYNPSPIPAYLRGGKISGISLATLQGYSGSLTVIMDGYPHVAGSITLAAATSFSSAATIIQTALTASEPTEATFTGSIGASFTGTGSGTNLTTTVVTGVIHVGATVTGTGVPANTTIVSQTSGTVGGAGVYVTNNATTSSGNALTSTSNVLDVTGSLTGTVAAGQTLTGTGLPSTGYVVTGQLSGTAGGVGTYSYFGTPLVIVPETITAVATAPTVTYDSVQGAFTVTSGISGVPSTAAFATGTIAASVLLTQATGAILSQGAAAAVPATFMNALTVTATNWVTFGSTFDPDAAFFTGSISGTTLTVATVYSGAIAIGDALAAPGILAGTTITAGSGLSWTVSNSQTVGGALSPVNMSSWAPGGGHGNAVKQAFAAWKNTQNNRYAYVCWDTDVTPTNTLPATASLGQILLGNNDSGTALVWAPDGVTGPQLAAFAMGAAASVNYTQRNGRATFAFKSQTGITATVTTQLVSDNLGGNIQTANRGNGYNYYGAFGSANVQQVEFQRGFVTGPYNWLDSYINAIWFNNQLQVAMLNLQRNSLSIPYTTSGNTLIDNSLASPIQAGLNFGAFAPGTISASEIAAVNAAAGINISGTLQTQGYYVQILPASSASRAARTTPPCTLWYLDRGSVQSLALNSVALQ